MSDVSIQSTGDGFDYVLTENTVEISAGLYNTIILSLFGGNVEQSTQDEYADGENRFDYFANSLLFDDDEQIQFNSETERALLNNALTSAGRVAIEAAVRADLEKLELLGEFESSVSIVSNNRIAIFVKVTEPTGTQNQQFSFIWDQTLNAIITENTL